LSSGIEVFSLGSEATNILATWAFNNRVRDGIGLLVLGLVKNPEDCRELSHHHHHQSIEVKPSVY
jgi:hypothetical protein